MLNVEEFASRASHLYQQHGSPESAASALDKASKVVEQKHPEIALRFYQRALDISMVSFFISVVIDILIYIYPMTKLPFKIEDSSRTAAEYACKVSRILVKLQM